MSGTAIVTAAASFTDAAGASFTDFASGSYSDFASGSYSDLTGASTAFAIATTFVDNAAYQAATPTPWPPPPGVTANFNDPNLNGKSYIVVTVVGLFFATAMTLMRLYTKAYIVRRVGWDDYTCGLSLMGLIVWSGMTIKMARLFLGDHIWNVNASNEKIALYYKLGFFANQIYLIVLCSVKVSILLLYLRTFHICGRKFRMTLYSVLVLLVTTHFVGIPVDAFSFRPFKCLWEYNDVSNEDYDFLCHQRYSSFPYFVFLGVLTILLDLIIIFLPSREVWGLKMVKRQKIGLVIVFLAGIVVTIASTLRLFFSIHRFYFDEYWDNEYTEFQIDLASTIELDLALICASVPPLQAFVKRFAPKLLNLDAPQASPNEANLSLRFNDWRKQRTLSAPSYNRSSVTADLERQSPMQHQKSIDGSYIKISEDAKSNDSYLMTTYPVGPRSTYTTDNPR